MSVMKPLEWEVVDQDDGPVGRIGSSRENSPQIFLRYVKKTAIVITDFVYYVLRNLKVSADPERTHETNLAEEAS